MTPSALAGGVGRKARWTRELIIEKIQEWHSLYGEAPRAADWNPSAAKWAGAEWRIERYRAGDWPSLNAVKRVFDGSLNAAITAAGLEPNKPGPPSRRAAAAPSITREVMSPAARVRLDAAEARVRELEELVEVRDRMVARARQATVAAREAAEVARRERRPKVERVTKTRTKTKVVRERVVDDAAVKRAEARVERAEAAATAARDQAREAKAMATKLASRLERAEATVSTLRDERREMKLAAKADADRMVALERMLAEARAAEPEVEVRVEREVIEVQSPEAREVNDARRAVVRAQREREAAEERAAKAERELRETVAVVTGEERRLTSAEMSALRAKRPSGPSVLAGALKLLAKARAEGGKAPMREALTKVASAAVTWRDAL